MSEEAFIRSNLGRFAIRQAGILVRKAFNTDNEARKWAEWNYKNRANWTIEKLSKETAIP